MGRGGDLGEKRPQTYTGPENEEGKSAIPHIIILLTFFCPVVIAIK